MPHPGPLPTGQGQSYHGQQQYQYAHGQQAHLQQQQQQQQQQYGFATQQTFQPAVQSHHLQYQQPQPGSFAQMPASAPSGLTGFQNLEVNPDARFLPYNGGYEHQMFQHGAQQSGMPNQQQQEHHSRPTQYPQQPYHFQQQTQQPQQPHFQSAYPTYQQDTDLQHFPPQNQPVYQQPAPDPMGQASSAAQGQPTAPALPAMAVQQNIPPPQPLHRDLRATESPRPQSVHTNRSHQNSPRQAIAQSPALPARSPAISKRSPATGSVHSPATSTRPSPALSAKSRPFDTKAILVQIAEECFSKAHTSLPIIVNTLSDEQVQEYQKLVSTGLACLNAAIHSNKLTPRHEAKARLRYASILYEETENTQEVETTLFQGIKLCEKHRFADLKYCMQYVSLKVLYQRNPKAAFIAIDKQIADCQTFKHIPWVYSFRLLRASLQGNSGRSPDSAFVENLHHLGKLAHERGDHALGVLASLLEGLAHLRSLRPETMEKVQACLAQAAKYQLDPSAQLPQLDVLTLLLGLACSMHHKSPELLIQRVGALQARMNAALDAKGLSDGATLRIPIKGHQSSSHIMSEDTSGILQPGGPNEPVDHITMSFATEMELFLLLYTFNGLASMYRPGMKGAKKSVDAWGEALHTLQQWTEKRTEQNAALSTSLQESARQMKWRTELFCYLQLLTGLYCATQSKWSSVEQCVAKLEKAAGNNVDEVFGLFALYLAGVYHQGTGDLETALILYEDERLNLQEIGPNSGGRKPAKTEICILAALNRLWILQAPAYYDERTATGLLEKLRSLCSAHEDLEIRTAFDLALATVQTNPPQSMQSVKQSISSALGNAQKTSNIHCLSMALNVMRFQLFDNVVGEQALKSAKAASTQAKRSGNILWMSVADGMLAHSFEAQGQMADAQSSRNFAAEQANYAFTGRD